MIDKFIITKMADVENEWKSRFRRTVRITLDVAGRPYSRGDFVRRVTDTTGLSSLEAVGPTQQSHIWELTFATPLQQTQFLSAGDFDVRGHAAKVSGADSTTVKVRLHWIPYYVSNELFVNMFERHGMKVVASEFEKSTVKGLEHVSTGIRCLTLRTDKVAEIPHVVSFRDGEREMEALITMTGRLPRCLRCNQNGHVRNKCTAPFCYRCRRFGHKKTDATCTGRSYSNATAGGSKLPYGVPEEEEIESEEVPSGTAPAEPGPCEPDVDIDDPATSTTDTNTDANASTELEEAVGRRLEEGCAPTSMPAKDDDVPETPSAEPSEDSAFVAPPSLPISASTGAPTNDGNLVLHGKRSRNLSSASQSSFDGDVSDTSVESSQPSSLSSTAPRPSKPEGIRPPKSGRGNTSTKKSDDLDASCFLRTQTRPVVVSSKPRKKVADKD